MKKNVNVLETDSRQDRAIDPRRASGWQVPSGCDEIRVIDAHAAGEPLRVIVDGYPEPCGETVLKKRADARNRLDSYRQAVIHEPRGHADMYGCLVLPPTTAGAHFSVLFLHNEGYSSMCGHGIIAVVTVVIETGMIEVDSASTARNESPPATIRLRIDTPAGRVTATAHMDGKRVERVSFLNVPSFVDTLDADVHVPGLGSVRYDLAFGGAYYAFVRAHDVELSCSTDDVPRQIDLGKRIKQAIVRDRTIIHPTEADLGFLYGTIFTEDAEDSSVFSRNVCVFADGEVDRSPTGTGVSARAAIEYARGTIEVDQAIWIESLIGSRFSVRIEKETTFGDKRAVIPDVSGKAFITGRSTFILDPDDPFTKGFLLR